MAVAMFSIAASAQVYVGGSLSVWNDDDADKTGFFIAPEVGYNINSNWAVGIELAYADKNASSYGASTFAVSPYARYTYFNQGVVSLFVDGGFSYATIDADGVDDGFNIGLKPGFAVKLSDKFSLVSKFGFLGYASDYPNVGTGFGLDFTNNVSFGFFVNF